jgi:hypothetical protein
MASVPVMSDAAHTPNELKGADQRYQHRSEGTVSLHASSGNGGALGVTKKANRSGGA